MLTSAGEWTPGQRSVCISGVCGPAPLTAIVKPRMRRLLTIGLLLVVLGTGSFVVLPWRAQRPDPKKRATFEGRNPVSADLLIQGEHVGSLTNLDALMSLLRTGRPVQQHRCSYPGILDLRFPGGDTNRVSLRPGHTNANYEFHCSEGLFAVSRKDFMCVLAASGVDTNRIPTR